MRTPAGTDPFSARWTTSERFGARGWESRRGRTVAVEVWADPFGPNALERDRFAKLERAADFLLAGSAWSSLAYEPEDEELVVPLVRVRMRHTNERVQRWSSRGRRA